MPELTPTGAVDVVQRQVRRVRRRKNLYELQRALYWAIAAAAGLATFLLPLALFAPARLFAGAAWGTLAVLAGFALILLAATRRRWLGAPRAIAWIESQSPLAGRLRTLVELATRPNGGRGFFHALLVAQVGHDLEAWTPRRVVPRAVPRAALATAAAALVLLVVVAQLASFAPPSTPAVGFSDQPLAGERSATPDDAAVGERVVVAPGVPADDDAEPSPVRDDVPSRLGNLSSQIQENVRQQVWGKAWERVRDALARAGTSSGAARDGQEETGDEVAANDTEDWEAARSPSATGAPRRRPGIGKQDSQHDAAKADQNPDEATPHDADRETHSDDADGGSGAGTGTGPNLFGGPSVDSAGSGSFELALAARMRADRAHGKRGTGAAGPNADPDAQPALAAEQRRESAAHRMTVPAAYETVVREVFAHRRVETEQP